MFRGQYEHTVDPKGRTSVPARFRELLARRAPLPPAAAIAAPAGAEPETEAGPAGPELHLIITTGIDRCLVAYPPDTWEAFEAKLASLSQFEPSVVMLKRIYVAGATECPIDRHGRLLIPPVLRGYAGIERDVVWAGMVDIIELWAKQAWRTELADSREDRQAIAKVMAELGL